MFRVINRLRLFDDQCDAENKDRDPGFRGKDYEDIRWDFIGKTTKIIQVPMKETLLKQIDVTAGVVSESRSVARDRLVPPLKQSVSPVRRLHNASCREPIEFFYTFTLTRSVAHGAVSRNPQLFIHS